MNKAQKSFLAFVSVAGVGLLAAYLSKSNSAIVTPLFGAGLFEGEDIPDDYAGLGAPTWYEGENI